MIYLVLGILMGSLMTILFKLSDRLHINGDNMILINYVVAASVSIFKGIRENIFAGFFNTLSGSAFGDILSVKSVSNTYLLFVVLGIVNGAFFIIDLVNTKNSIKFNGAGLSSLFSKFGFLITTGFAMIFWREIPSAIQVLGIGLAVVALLIASSKLSESGTVSKPLLLLQLTLFAGLAEINNKATVYYAVNESYNSLYISIIFTTALIISFFYIGITNKKEHIKFKITIPDILGGLGTGLPNVMSSFFILKALETVPTNVYYPTSAAGNLILTTLLSALVFKEKLTKRQIIAIIIMTVSLALINL